MIKCLRDTVQMFPEHPSNTTKISIKYLQHSDQISPGLWSNI